MTALLEYLDLLLQYIDQKVGGPWPPWPLQLPCLCYHPWKEVQFFATNTKTHQCTIKFHCQNEVVLGGLLLLAAFLQPTDNPYEGSGSLMELWWEGRELCVTVKLHGVELRPLLSLHNHFCYLSALCGPYQGLFHLHLTFFMNPLTVICPCHPPINELAWYYHLGANLCEKNYVNWWKTCFLANWLEDSFKSRKLLYIV